MFKFADDGFIFTFQFTSDKMEFLKNKRQKNKKTKLE